MWVVLLSAPRVWLSEQVTGQRIHAKWSGLLDNVNVIDELYGEVVGHLSANILLPEIFVRPVYSNCLLIYC